MTVLVSMLSSRMRASSAASTGVLPFLATCLGPRIECAGSDNPLRGIGQGVHVLDNNQMRPTVAVCRAYGANGEVVAELLSRAIADQKFCTDLNILLPYVLAEGLRFFLAFAQRARAAFLASSFRSCGVRAAMRAFTPLPFAALPPFLPISLMTLETTSRLIALSYDE
jgi:hypothetical protein